MGHYTYKYISPTNANIKAGTAYIETFNLLYIFINVTYICTVPHSESGVVPMSSLSGVGQLGFWEVGKGGTIG